MDVIGRGGFGKVWKVRKKKNKMLYALKIMSKAKYIINHISEGSFKRKVSIP